MKTHRITQHTRRRTCSIDKQGRYRRPSGRYTSLADVRRTTNRILARRLAKAWNISLGYIK